MKVEDWRKLGSFYKILNHQIFVIDSQESSTKKSHLSEITPQTKPTLVILHGYPTSTFDYHKVLKPLSDNYRVVMHDHLGFGFSDKPKNIQYSLIDQADRAIELWNQLGLTKLTIFAHDYGTSVATEIIARSNAKEINFEIEQLILSNGSIHIELSQLRTIQKLLKHKVLGKYVAFFTNFSIFKKNMRNIYYDKSKVSDQELREMWHLIEFNSGRKIFHKLTQYINERYEYWDRWVGALKETQIPTKIIWAKNDPIAIPKIAEVLASEIPNNELIWMEHTGHFLMLENPKKWTQLLV